MAQSGVKGLFLFSLILFFSFFGLGVFPLTFLYIYNPFSVYLFNVVAVGTLLFFLKTPVSLCLFLSSALGVFLFAKFLKKKTNMIISLWIAVLVPASLLVISFFILEELSLSEGFKAQLQVVQGRVFNSTALSSISPEEKKELFHQWPSISLAFFMGTLFLSWIWTPFLGVSLQKKSQSPEKKKQSVIVTPEKSLWLGPFWQDRLKVPFMFVWLFCLALVGAFLIQDPAINTVSLNLLNVVFFTYFLQGMAILKKYFQIFKVGVIWRGVGYAVVFVLGLVMFISFLGLLEEWIPFRKKWLKRPPKSPSATA